MEIVSYLRGIGLPVENEGSGYKLKTCPFCKHNDCFKISSEGFFKCFSCQVGGDHFKFESLRQGVSYSEAKRTLTGESVSTTPCQELEMFERNHKRLIESPESLKWLTNTRKIPIEIIKQFKVGCFSDDLGNINYSFPYFVGTSVANVKYRTVDKKMYFKKGQSEFLYNKNAINNTEVIMIVEGELDCIAAYAYKLKIPCISVGLGAGTVKPSWRNDLQHIKEIYLAFDNDSAGQSGAIKFAEFIGESKCRIVKLPLKDFNDCLIAGIEKNEIEQCIQKSLSIDQIKLIDAINAVPQDELIVGEKLDPIFEMISRRPQTELEDYLKLIRVRFPDLTYRQILDFRKRIKLLIEHDGRNLTPSVQDKPVEIPQELQDEAMKFLKTPNIIETLQEWLTDIGIVGEDINKVCLWLFFLSRKLEKPIHSVVYGQSSSGKSELVKKILTTIPKEEVLEFTSMSTHSLDYRDSDLIGKVLFIAEMDGSDEVEYALRIAMSEGKLIRAFTIKDPVTGELKNAEKAIEVKSAFVLTTTRPQIHNENSTRVWGLFADESIKQTQRVLEYIKTAQSREYRRLESRRRRLVEILKAAQGMLKPLDVEIPFAHLLEFPSQTTRNRRDLGRFISFIKVVAFLRQYQKSIIGDEMGEYIEADLSDYSVAYALLLPIMRNTLSEVTPRGMAVLEICCILQNQRNNQCPSDPSFTVKEIQDMGATRSVDMKNVVNLRQQLQTLCNGEYLELVGGSWGAKGGRHKFKVICEYNIEGDEVKNIKSNNTGILSPDELASRTTNHQNIKK